MRHRISIFIIILTILCVNLYADESTVKLSTQDGSTAFQVKNSNNDTVFSINSLGNTFINTGIIDYINDYNITINSGKLLNFLTIQAENADFLKLYATTTTIKNDQLYIASDLDMTGRVFLNLNDLYTRGIKANSSAGLYLLDKDNIGLFIKDGGNVGIGIEDPNLKLEVLGNIKTDYEFSANTGSITDVYTDSVTVMNSSLDIRDNKVLNALTVEFNIADFNNIYVSTITGVTTLNINNDLDLMNNNIKNVDKLYVTSVTARTSDGLYVFDSNDNIAISVNNQGYVGIGKEDAEEYLDVAGTIRTNTRIDAATGTFSGVVVATEFTDSTLNILDGNLKNALTIEASLGTFYDFNVSSVTVTNDIYLLDSNSNLGMYVNENNGYVGIGHDNPQEILDVTGSVKTDFELTCTTASFSKTVSVLNELSIGDITISNEKLLGATTIEASIATFDNFYSGTLNFKNNPAAILSDLDLKSNNIYDANIISANKFKAVSSDLSIKNSNGDDMIYVDSVGRVGIGTDTPSEKLDIVGTLNVTGTLDASTGTFTSTVLAKAVHIPSGATDIDKIVFNNSGQSGTYDFHGIGGESATTVYNVRNTSSKHVFSESNGGTGKNDLMTINGDGDVTMHGGTKLGNYNSGSWSVPRIKTKYIQQSFDDYSSSYIYIGINYTKVIKVSIVCSPGGNSNLRIPPNHIAYNESTAYRWYYEMYLEDNHVVIHGLSTGFDYSNNIARIFVWYIE